MLSVKKVQSSGKTTDYFAKDDYYASDNSNHQKFSSWYGKGAEELGLEGHVTSESFRKVLEGNLPNGQKEQNFLSQISRGTNHFSCSELNKNIIAIDAISKKLYLLIKSHKKSLFGKLNPIVQQLQLLETKEKAVEAIQNYSVHFNTDLIQELASLSPNFATQKEVLKPFIEFGIISKEYPFKTTVNETQ